MKKINSKTCAALLLSALLAACGGGGSGSSNSTTTSSTTAINSAPNTAPKTDDAALAALKEKEALQKAEQERQKRLKEEEEKQKNAAQAEPPVPQPAPESQPKPTEPAPQPAPEPQPKPTEPAPQPAPEPQPKPVDPVPQLEPKPVEPTAPQAVEYQGYVISQNGKSAWNGEASGYQVKQQGDEFNAVIAQGSSLQIGDMKLDLIDSSNANLGYYGYVSTFTPDSGVVGQDSGEKRTVDLMYAVDQSKKDATAPTLNGYQGTVTYGGDFHYLADTDKVNKANISLSYNPAAKTMAGNIRDTSKGIDLGLQLSGELNGDFQMIATPVKNNHTSTVVTEKGSLNGQFLDGGKYIVGDAESGDANKQWKGVFSTKETERVPN
ncbi:hypothetical protein [Testudinibacter aquarius]|uniref:Transferrin-binding protein B C-lobe/N-lobe beta barrel domain-containing protein n=1 Tax=Testudinibacter aquarius TaxID=1524974 RepID=A0A4V2W1N4_9PAST|nr:hypothetical protein [Testudinibacter aquarius]KAE9528279.1 hypothetical protein A1D24_10600 [Testudinibacter aquarius]TCV84809.1 hypothetical protein EDC16_11038 [Testudinibacter aquarius]